MNATSGTAGSAPTKTTNRDALPEREAGLLRGLTSWQLAMIGLGSCIGTGLFLGSAVSVKLAGPAVILSFAAAACIALTMMLALAEMAAAHPAAGSFGLYAEMYLHPWAGFAIRLTYWLCMMAAVGSEVVATAIYCSFWFPHVPAWMWIALFSALILYLNTVSVGSFGKFENWLSITKVVTIVVFLLLATALLIGIGFPRIGFANYTAYGGFFPHGWTGVGLGVVMGLFSFFGIEVVGSTAGEAANPQVAVPRALRRTLLVLVIAYSIGILTTVADLRALHPYEYIYCNHLVAGGLERANQQIEMDYWGTSFREAALWIKQYYRPPGVSEILYALSPPNVVPEMADYFLEQPASDGVKFRRILEGENPNVCLALRRQRQFVEFTSGRILHSVKRQGVSLLDIIEP